MSLDRRLLMFYADGECGPDEAAQVEAELRASPLVQHMFAEILRQRLLLAEVLVRSPAASEVPLVVLPGEQAGQAASPARPWTGLGRRPLIAAAALLAAAVLIGATVGLVLPGAPGPAPAGRVMGTGGTASGALLEYGDALTPTASEPVRAELADGSRIEVGAGGQATVTARRRLQLDAGAVQVSCHHDPEHPFVVTAGDTSVRALGTEFIVEVHPAGVPGGTEGNTSMEEERAMGKLVSVVVLSGAVMITNPFGDLRLAAGETAESPEGGRPERGRSEVADRNQDPHGPHTGMTHDSGTVDQGWHGDKPDNGPEGKGEKHQNRDQHREQKAGDEPGSPEKHKAKHGKDGDGEPGAGEGDDEGEAGPGRGKDKDKGEKHGKQFGNADGEAGPPDTEHGQGLWDGDYDDEDEGDDEGAFDGDDDGPGRGDGVGPDGDDEGGKGKGHGDKGGGKDGDKGPKGGEEGPGQGKHGPGDRGGFGPGSGGDEGDGDRGPGDGRGRGPGGGDRGGRR